MWCTDAMSENLCRGFLWIHVYFEVYHSPIHTSLSGVYATHIDWLCFIDHKCLGVPFNTCDGARDSLRAWAQFVLLLSPTAGRIVSRTWPKYPHPDSFKDWYTMILPWSDTWASGRTIWIWLWPYLKCSLCMVPLEEVTDKFSNPFLWNYDPSSKKDPNGTIQGNCMWWIVGLRPR